MRRGSMAMMGGGEPLIVVEESGIEEGDGSSGGTRGASPCRGFSMDQESPPDPYHLSPWRDTRKHSLPTPACTSGPTASQVRRLSERGEIAAREAREAAFLATLSQAPPQLEGRRHSVVTISRVPQSMFGRGRRESIAAFPALGRRRDSGSIKKCPPATDTLGSTHNLQLDIMDDIVQARKVRMRLWNTSSERVCEVQPLDSRSPGADGSVRYTNRGRRHSDAVGSPLPPIPARRRASDMPPASPRGDHATHHGIVCTDTDLHGLHRLLGGPGTPHALDTLTSSAAEIDRCGRPEARRPPLSATRSTSFDASSKSGGKWFARRHQTLADKNETNKKTKVRFADDTAAVVWDEPSGSVVDARALGSAIEVFLRKSGADNADDAAKTANADNAESKCNSRGVVRACTAVLGAVLGDGDEEDAAPEGCDAAICSSLKDLFV